MKRKNWMQKKPNEEKKEWMKRQVTDEEKKEMDFLKPGNESHNGMDEDKKN
jgi:hypothetical protein